MPLRSSTWLILILMIGPFTLGVITGKRLQSMDDIGATDFTLPILPNWADDPLPDFLALTDSSERKAAFFQFLLPRVQLANERFLLVRKQLSRLAGKSKLTSHDRALLQRIAEVLRIEDELGSKAFFNKALRRVDAIPPSLVLAQAANESAWGTSRFARDGNNLFGQWCFDAGCGLVPSRRSKGASHEVAQFASPYRSVAAYMINLNRHPSYDELRTLRQTLRNDDNAVSGLQLARGLHGYSERGQDYVDEIAHMIRINNLQKFDLAPADKAPAP